MTIRHTISLLSLLFVACFAIAQEKPVLKKVPVKHTSAASGKEMYTQYCAACHGADGKGTGPAVAALKTPPPDLTTLAKRHDGKYPSEHVANILKFGADVPAHGTSDMPTWGPLFKSLDPTHDAIVMQRIKNLNDYLESLQAK